MVECADGSLYTGWTNRLPQRIAAHNRGRGAKYTRSRLPVRLVWAEAQPDSSAALRREAALKRLTRREKLALIAAAPLSEEPASQ
jgi:putative endonuclease